MRARRSLSEACSQPSNLVYTTKEAPPAPLGRISSSIPKSVSLSSYSVQLSAMTRAVHSTTPSHSLCTWHRPVPVGFGKPCGRGACLTLPGELIQRQLVRGAVGVGGAGGDDFGYGAHRVAAPQVHHPDTLRRAALSRDRVSIYADGRPEVGDDHELVQSRAHDPHAGEFAAFSVGLHCDHSLAAASMGREPGEGGALAETALGEYEKVGRVVGDHVHREHYVVFTERDALDPGRSTSHRTCVGLLEADALAIAAHDDDFVAL